MEPLISKLAFASIYCCYCHHVVNVCLDWRKTQPALQPFPSNHPWVCSNDELHCNGKRQWRDGTDYYYGHLEMLPGCCTGLCCNTELEILEIDFDQPCDALWDLEEVEHCP